MADVTSYPKAPAYQYYPDNFEQGTATFTLAEVGGYQRLLNYQWSNGSVPGDSERALASIMRCTPSTARSVWRVIAEKFDKGSDGGYRNKRMESERQKQWLYREQQANKGRASGESRRNRGSVPVPTEAPTEREPEGNSSSPSSSSSTSSKNDDVPRAPRVASAALVMNPLHYQRLRERNAFVGSRLRIPFVLHDELRSKLGGVETEARLQGWYGELDEWVERSAESILDVFEWIRPRFREWAQASVDEQGREALLASLKAIEVANGR